MCADAGLMLDDIEIQVEDKKKKDLTSYSNQRTFLVTMVAHLAVFLFTTFMVYSCVPGASKLLYRIQTCFI